MLGGRFFAGLRMTFVAYQLGRFFGPKGALRMTNCASPRHLDPE